jgi:hypothetical protein
MPKQVAMTGLDLENLSPKQKEILAEIWRVCEYLEVSRNWNIEDRLIREQARSIVFAMIDFRKEENKKNNSAVPA